MRLFDRRILTVLCLAAASCLPAMSAVKMSQTVVFGGIGESHAGRSTTTTETLISGLRSRTETSMEFEGKLMKRFNRNRITIHVTDAQAKLMREIHPKPETYTETTFAEFMAHRDQMTEQLAALRGQTPTQATGDKDSRPQMNFRTEAKTTPAGMEEIAGYNARLLDVLIKMFGSYPESTETCEIHVKARLGLAKTPGSDEIKTFNEAVAKELGFSKAQLLGASQSMLSAIGNYAEGFEELYKEIRKHDETLLRQHLLVRVKGACGGPPPGAEPQEGQAMSQSDGGDDQTVAPRQRMKKAFTKFKLGRKNKNKDQDASTVKKGASPPADDGFMDMLKIDLDTQSYEKVENVGMGPFNAPAGYKKVKSQLPNFNPSE